MARSVVVERLTELVASGVSAETGAWLSATVAAAAHGDFGAAFSSAGRRLGTHRVLLRGEDRQSPLGVLVEGRGFDEIGRMALLLARLDALPDGHEAIVGELFYRGEVRERHAVLRALPLLPRPGRFLDIGVEAVRSSVQTIFEAIACENPYAADHFSESAFNQMVLKALFNETPVARIAGLDRRAGAELVRMARSYGSERLAAGRRVPEDIETIAALGRPAQRC